MVAVTAVVWATKDPEEAPAATVRVGTVTAALLLEIATLAPLAAAAESVTVHVLEAPPTTDAGEQLTEEIVTAGGSTVTARDAVWEEPL